jgi:hypothetical protein
MRLRQTKTFDQAGELRASSAREEEAPTRAGRFAGSRLRQSWRSVRLSRAELGGWHRRRLWVFPSCSSFSVPAGHRNVNRLIFRASPISVVDVIGGTSPIGGSVEGVDPPPCVPTLAHASEVPSAH